MKLLTGLLLGLLLLAPVHAFAAAAKTVQVGDATIMLPVMDGFVELYGKSPDFDKIVEHFVPEGNKLLAVYLSDADVVAMNADPQAGLKKYILVQANLNGNPVNTPADFNAVKEDFANQIGSGSWQDDKTITDAMDNVSGYVKNQFGQAAALKIGDTRYLGKIVDTPDALAVMMLTNYGMTTAKGEESYPVVAGLSTLQLKSNVVVAFVYSNYGAPADMDFVSQNLRKFVAQAVSLNNTIPVDAAAANAPTAATDDAAAKEPGDKAPDKPAPDADIGGAMFWATKAAVIIAVLAALLLLLPKLAKHFRRRDESL